MKVLCATLLILISGVLFVIFYLSRVGVIDDRNHTPANAARSFVTYSLKSPILKFRIDTGRYPTTQEGIEILINGSGELIEGWKGPYISDLPKDPWGNYYLYRYPSTNSENEYDFYSFGPDGYESEDDIGNW